MSSVPAPRIIERLPLSPRPEGSAPDRTGASLRLVHPVPDLYPGLLAAIRAAFRVARKPRTVRVSRDLSELGRATGARV